MKKTSLNNKFVDKFNKPPPKPAKKKEVKLKDKKSEDGAPNNEQEAMVMSYNEIRIKSLQFKIGWISEDLQSCGLDCILKYAFDIEKIQENKMKEVTTKQKASKVMLASFSKKYKLSPASLDDADQGDIDDDVKSNDDDDDDMSEEFGSDGSEEIDLDDDEETKRFETLMGSKGNQVSEYRIFVKTHQLPVLNIYATFKCELKEMDKSSMFKFPPEFAHMVILSVENSFAKKSHLVVKTLQDLIKCAPWASVKLRESLRSAEILGNKQDIVMLRSSLYFYVKDKSLFPLVDVAFRDTFRNDVYEWVCLNFPSLDLQVLDDPEALAFSLYQDIVNGKLEKLAFASREMPLNIAHFMWRIRGGDTEEVSRSYMKGLMDQDTGTLIELYKDVSDDVIEANNLWCHFRKTVGLYQGRLVWNVEGSDVEKYKPCTQLGLEEAARWLADNNHVMGVENTMVPMYAVNHWALLINNCIDLKDNLDIICAEQITATDEFFYNLITETCGLKLEDLSHVNFLCPTKQASRRIIAQQQHLIKDIKGCIILKAQPIDKVFQDLEHWIERVARTNKSINTVILTDMHLFSSKQFVFFLCMMAKVISKYEESEDKIRIKLVLCGASVMPVLNEHQTPSAGFAHVINSMSNKEAEPLCMTTALVDSSENRINSDVLAKKVHIVAADSGNNSNDNSEKDLTNSEIFDIALYLTSILKDRDHQKVCLLFENNAHMKQIVNHAQYTNTVCNKFFYTGGLSKNDYVIEADGGMRKITELRVNKAPGTAAKTEICNKVDFADVPSDLVFYVLDHGIECKMSSVPITHARYLCLPKCRFSPVDEMLYVAVFTVKNRKFSQSDLNYLSYLGSNVLMLSLPKKTGMDIRHISLMSPVNFFDLSLVKYVDQQNEDVNEDNDEDD